MPLASPTKPQGRERGSLTAGRHCPALTVAALMRAACANVMAAHLSEASRSVAMLMRHSLIRRGNSLFSRENSLFWWRREFRRNRLIYRAESGR